MTREPWEKMLQKALALELENQPQPDGERVWQKIETTIMLVEKSRKRPRQRLIEKRWFKVSALAACLVLAFGLFGITQMGEALPFGSVFQGLRKIAGDSQTMVQFSYGDEQIPGSKTDQQMPPPEVEEIPLVQTESADLTLEELQDIYPGELYYPQEIPFSAVQETSYLHTHTDHLETPIEEWTIMMDFSMNGKNISLEQRDTIGEGSSAVAYGKDTEVSVHRKEGIEYMAAEMRYGIVNIKWMTDDKMFNLTGNLEVEEALSIAQSVSPLE